MIWAFIKSFIGSLVLVVDDWLHPGQKEERERIAGEAKAQDTRVEAETARQEVLSKEAVAQDAAIAEDKAELKEALKPLPKVTRTEDEEFDRLSGRIK